MGGVGSAVWDVMAEAGIEAAAVGMPLCRARYRSEHWRHLLPCLRPHRRACWVPSVGPLWTEPKPHRCRKWWFQLDAREGVVRPWELFWGPSVSSISTACPLVVLGAGRWLFRSSYAAAVSP